MQVKVYVPQMVEIPSEYLPALVQRACTLLGDSAADVPGTRGHLVRQAVRDGLLRDFDPLVREDGTVDVVCDPGGEIPLEIENRVLTLNQLFDALQSQKTATDNKSAPLDQFDDTVISRREAA